MSIVQNVTFSNYGCTCLVLVGKFLAIKFNILNVYLLLICYDLTINKSIFKGI